MHLILIALVVVIVTVVSITLFMMWLTEKTTHASLTERFQDAEFILAEHRPPASWRRRRPLFSRLMQGELGLRRRPRNAPADRLLERLDRLIRFFETCPFFETEEARQLMLEQLRCERERWAREFNEAVAWPEHADQR